MRPTAAICRELTADRRTDGELLAAFAAGPSEDAFAELVRRHGPLVWGACRRLLPDPSDAEDAFQAAFLVLVRRARGLSRCTALGPWLHRVAVWTARNVRRKNARRLARQSALPDHVPDPAPQPDPDLKADLDAALLALPARYRDPILLCHLQGYSRREAAERLGCAEGTLSAWLSRGLAKLRTRLRGLDPAKVLSVAAVSAPAVLTATTARAAVATAVAAAGVPPAVTVLVKGVLHMFCVKKATAATFALCAVFAMGLGAGLGTRTEHTGAGAQDDPTKPPDPKKAVGTDLKLSPKDELMILEQAAENAVRKQAILMQHFQLTKANLDKKLAELRKIKPDAKLSPEEEVALAKIQKEADEAGAAHQSLTDKITMLRAAPPADDAARLHELTERQRELDRLANQQVELERRKAALDAQKAELEAKIRALQQMKPRSAGTLNLTIRGKAGEVEYVIFEVPGDHPKHLPPPYTPYATRDPVVLARLLTRAKNDPVGPQEVLVTAEPQTALGVGPAAALKACDAAGYKTVKFTGYVFQGGLALELKPDQTGDVRGYKRYDAAEVKPKELAEEIAEGMKRF